MIITEQFINDINFSNCYIVKDQKRGKCIAIDPGSRNVNHILEYIYKEKLGLDYVLLTHSHFDHIAGVTSLLNRLKAEIISSRLCSVKMQNPIMNLSHFTDFGEIVAPVANIEIEDLENNSLDWNENTILFHKAPGHTKCSILIQLGKNLFTGDTLLNGIISKVTQPDGNREELRSTLEYIYEVMPSDTLILPGHGKSFVLNTQKLEVSLKK
jgi:hydroxyacylglutathione hydrolase